MRAALILLALALAFGVAATATAAAQDTGPGPPMPLVAPQTRAPSPAPNEGPSPPAGIVATPLGPIDPSWGSALPPGAAPLPADMWQGTPRPVVRAALALLAPSESPGIVALTRRLLLSGAIAPAGRDPAGGPSLLLLRARRLADLGMITGAAAVIDLVRPEKRTEPMARLRVELAFAGNDIAGACRRVGAAIATYRQIWWDRARIACDLLAGDRDKAAMALDILHDRDEPPDPAFDGAVAAAGGRAATLAKSARFTPLLITLWAAGKQPVPAGIVATADPATLATLAGSATEPAANRLAAAERAASLGAWPAERLARLYAAVTFDGDERAKLMSDAGVGDTPRGRALLFQAARGTGDGAARAEALRRFLEAASRHGLAFVGARIAAPLIIAIRPDEKDKGAAPAFARALVAAGRAHAIEPWLALPGHAQLVPLATIVHAIEGGNFAPDAHAISRALAMLAARKGATAPRQIAMFEMLAAAFGAALSPSEFAAEMAPAHEGEIPSLALWLDQRDAAIAHRRGETILTSLILASTTHGRLTLEPILLARALAGFRAAGLDDETRAIALEAAVAAGL